MEELINKLIEKGWKPRGIYTSLIVGYGLVRCEEYVGSPNNERKSYRQLVSKESGLWQFVCENGLIPEDKMRHERVLDLTFGPYGPEVEAQMHSRTYEYWLMSSALCNEEDLEKFLLDNIKI